MTATDKQNELLVTHGLKKQFPSHAIIGGKLSVRDNFNQFWVRTQHRVWVDESDHIDGHIVTRMWIRSDANIKHIGVRVTGMEW